MKDFNDFRSSVHNESIVQIWYDEVLAWNVSEYPIDNVAMRAFEVWLPDFGSANR
jgi:hypothetical protein